MDYEVCVCWLAAATVRFGELSVLRETILQSGLGCVWWLVGGVEVCVWNSPLA